MTGRASFADRLNVARKLIARRSVPPVHLTDQLEAAGRERGALRYLRGDRRMTAPRGARLLSFAVYGTPAAREAGAENTGRNTDEAAA